MGHGRRERWRVRRLAVAAAVALALGSGAVGVAQEPTPEAFTGTYRYAGGARGRRALNEAIDRVVDQMSFLIRELARGAIRAELQPEARIRLRASATTVSFAWDDWSGVSVPLDGREVRGAGPDGSSTRFVARFQGGRITLRATTSRGYRQSYFSLSEDRRFLFLQAAVGASQLPEPIRYSLTYRRR